MTLKFPRHMFLTEYDEEHHMEMEREEWEAKGEIKGLIETCQELGVMELL